GRATPGLVESVRVDYYGAPTPLRQLATISVPEPRLLVIKPFDPSSLKEIEKAILKSDVGVTPQNDGKLLRLVVPPLSEERRRQVVNLAREKCEETRVSFRNVRRDGHRKADQGQKEKIFSEDDARELKDEIHEEMKKMEKKVDEVIAKKEKEIMEI
ncbi:MAG: ribosome recycling factor, partial [Planctomycetota bacterium]